MKRIWTIAAGLLILIPAGCSTPHAREQAAAPATQPAVAATTGPSSPNRPTAWWTEISKKPDSWYRSDEGKRITANILSWQDHGTGWPLMNNTAEPFTGDVSRAGPWGMRAALIKSTVNEIRFLARAYRATNDQRDLDALLGGLKFIFDAQYPTGGWPHSYPVRMTDYTHYATFNDEEMPDLMTLLQEVATSPDFESVGADNRKKASAAFDKGLEFILKSQIRVNGKLTAWCQQHDEVTYEPRAARKFEPVAITGSESAGILFVLMSIKKPSPEVVASVEAAVQWFHDVQLNGIEVIYKDGDRTVRENPSAPPLWARYYEIGTNRPIFAGRDGIVRYNLSEIEKERRGGYSWYSGSGTRVFARYAEWKYARKWDQAPPTNIDESKVHAYTLPDPLLMNDGKRVATVADWEQKRRPEIVHLFEQNQFGVTPTKQISATNEVVERGVSGMGGLSKRTQVRIRFSDDPAAPVIRVALNVPAGATGPVPTILHISFSPNVLLLDEPGIDEGTAWSPPLKARVPDRDARLLKDFDTKAFVEHGYGVATVYYGDIAPDFDDARQNGVRTLFGKPSPTRAPDDWGTISEWSWGLSRVMDYLQTDPAVDGKKVAVTGVSRLGKTVLWAAAMDQRFAMVVPMVSGEGGASLSRRNFGETVADLTNPVRYDYWYAPRYADFALDVEHLPVDGHMLVALIAPRPVLLVTGSEDTWSDPRGEFLSANAAAPVYQLYGKSGLGTTEFPAPETPILHDIGFFMHKGPHTVLPSDIQTTIAFMDMHFRH